MTQQGGKTPLPVSRNLGSVPDVGNGMRMLQRERLRRTLFGGGAKSSCGYRVYFNSRTSIEYVDRTNKIFVSAEALASRMSVAIYPDHMTIGTPNGPRLADDARRSLVVQRVHRAARFLGWDIS